MFLADFNVERGALSSASSVEVDSSLLRVGRVRGF